MFMLLSFLSYEHKGFHSRKHKHTHKDYITCYFIFLKDGNIELHYHILFLSLNFMSTHTNVTKKKTFYLAF